MCQCRQRAECLFRGQRIICTVELELIGVGIDIRQQTVHNIDTGRSGQQRGILAHSQQTHDNHGVGVGVAERTCLVHSAGERFENGVYHRFCI